MKASAGWCMTASSGEKPWHGRTSTGRPRTPGYTTRPSRAAPRPSRCNHCLHDDHVTSLCPRNPNQPLPPWFPDMLSWPGASFQQGHRPGPSSANDGTRAAANSRPANTGTSAWRVGGLTWHSNVHSDAPTQGVAHQSGRLPAS